MAEPSLRAIRVGPPPAALGMAVHYLMAKPAFAQLPFGEWSQVLVGQIHRNHYCFAVDAAERIHGFMGWAYADQARAEAWLQGRIGLAYEECLAGDCMIFNAWAAESTRANHFLLEEARKLFRDKVALYYKRHQGGRVRLVRLPVTDAVDRHLARAIGISDLPSSRQDASSSLELESGARDESAPDGPAAQRRRRSA